MILNCSVIRLPKAIDIHSVKLAALHYIAFWNERGDKNMHICMHCETSYLSYGYVYFYTVLYDIIFRWPTSKRETLRERHVFCYIYHCQKLVDN